jgi:hypothetical protein
VKLSGKSGIFVGILGKSGNFAGYCILEISGAQAPLEAGQRRARRFFGWRVGGAIFGPWRAF